MTENIPPATLPPPPSTAGAPGYDVPGYDAPGYDAPPGSNGHNPASMGPPSLPPVVIPQNNNTVASPITPGTAMSPSSGGVVRRAAPEPNKRALYVGGLDARVTEDVLKQIFDTAGHVVSVKIIPDKNVSCRSGGHHVHALTKNRPRNSTRKGPTTDLSNTTTQVRRSAP